MSRPQIEDVFAKLSPTKKMDVTLTNEQLDELAEEIYTASHSVARAQFTKINNWLRNEYGYEISANDDGVTILVEVKSE